MVTNFNRWNKSRKLFEKESIHGSILHSISFPFTPSRSCWQTKCVLAPQWLIECGLSRDLHFPPFKHLSGLSKSAENSLMLVMGMTGKLFRQRTSSAASIRTEKLFGAFFWLLSLLLSRVLDGSTSSNAYCEAFFCIQRRKGSPDTSFAAVIAIVNARKQRCCQ